jgi:hypothetical protein
VTEPVLVAVARVAADAHSPHQTWRPASQSAE